MRRFALSASIFAAAVTLSCGGEDGGGRPDEAGQTASRRTVAITDTIGVELGDSNYVFGAIEGVCFGPGGNIYAMDLVRGSAMVYGPDGRFIRSIAGRGEGPGEITIPLDMTVLNNGRVLITALGGVHGYTAEGEYLGILGEYLQNPPLNLTAVGDSSFLATKLSVAPRESGDVVMEHWLARLDDPSEPTLKLREGSMPFEPDNLTEMLQRTWFAYDIAGDRQGRIYLAPRSSEDFVIEVYSFEGELLQTIEHDVARARKTPEEIREEKDWMEQRLENMGVSGVVIEFEPDPYRRMITDLGVDGQGRIWARRGTELSPVFEVFSPEGEHLFTAEMPQVGEEGQFWEFAIEDGGMAAFSTNPELFQQIYVLQPEE
ncbi:MAG: hypothetical protein R6U36_02485 [Candidatus Fermentibacteraceae bacterium]